MKDMEYAEITRRIGEVEVLLAKLKWDIVSDSFGIPRLKEDRK